MKLSMQYGYIRVSSKEQNEERQYIAMREFGIQNENIILDKQSGKNFERPGYIQLTGKLIINAHPIGRFRLETKDRGMGSQNAVAHRRGCIVDLGTVSATKDIGKILLRSVVEVRMFIC